MFNLLVGPLSNLLGNAVKGFVETKKAKADLAWKDELILICLLVPAVAVFIPGWTPHIKEGFEALHSLPDYYKHLLYIACSASFGIKGAKGAMGLITKKK